MDKIDLNELRELRREGELYNYFIWWYTFHIALEIK